jgi:hypothetical protein
MVPCLRWLTFLHASQDASLPLRRRVVYEAVSLIVTSTKAGTKMWVAQSDDLGDTWQTRLQYVSGIGIKPSSAPAFLAAFQSGIPSATASASWPHPANKSSRAPKHRQQSRITPINQLMSASCEQMKFPPPDALCSDVALTVVGLPRALARPTSPPLALLPALCTRTTCISSMAAAQRA